MFGGWLVACGATVVAVEESYDLTLWQEIIANIIHSAVVIVKGTQHQEGIFPKKTGVKEKLKVSQNVILSPVKKC